MKEKTEENTTKLDKYAASIASAIFAQDKSYEKLKEVYNYFIEEFKDDNSHGS